MRSEAIPASREGHEPRRALRGLVLDWSTTSAYGSFSVSPNRYTLTTVDVRVKRVQQAASAGDGYRVLIDRLWPRGISKASAKLDKWLPDLAPSDELRRWYGHDPALFEEFGAVTCGSFAPAVSFSASCATAPGRGR